MKDFGLSQRLHWPGSAQHLALVRILFGAHLMEVFASPAMGLLQRINPAPHPLAKTWFPSFVEGWVASTLNFWIALGILCSVLFLVGIGTKWSARGLALAFFLTQNFWFRASVFHDDWVFMSFPLIVFCFAPCGDAWSVDAWWRARKGRHSQNNTQSYRWPIEALVFWFGFVYVAAGIAKLFPLQKGLLWLSGAPTREFSLQFLFDSPLAYIFGGTPFDYTLLWPFAIVSILTVIVELGMAWVWFSERYRWACIGAVLAMHSGIYMSGIPGFVQIALVCSAALIPSRLFPDFEATADRRLSTSPG